MFKQQSGARGELTTLTDEMLGNMKVVQAFGYEKEAEKRFQEINSRLAGCSLKATFFSSITNPATRFVNSMVYAAVGITGAWGVIRGLLTIGQLTSFLSYANQYTKPFNEISGVVTELQNALASAARVLNLWMNQHPGGWTGGCCFKGCGWKCSSGACELFLSAGASFDRGSEPERQTGAESGDRWPTAAERLP